MIITLTDDKKQKLKFFDFSATKIHRSSIRYLVVSCKPASKLGPLFFRALEGDKTKSLKMNKGEFDVTAILRVKAKQ